MEKLNLETFKSKIFDYENNNQWSYKGELPAIIDFYADWCGPCKALSPILEEIAQDYSGQVKVYKVDTDASPELASLFEVRGIPSLLFVPKTGEPSMAAGFIGKDGLERAIAELFAISKS